MSKNFKKKLSVALVFAMLLTLVCVRNNAVLAADATTVDMSAQGYENAQEVATVTSGDVTVTFSIGTNKSNGPKYYNSNVDVPAVRLYPNNTMTVSVASGTISKIVLTYGSGDNTNEITVDNGTFTTDTWEGSAQSVVFTVGGSSKHRRIAKVEVTTGAAASNTETPTAEVTDTPTDTPAPEVLTEAQILEAVKTLEAGSSIPGTQSLTGVITKINTEYSEQYGNITVTIKVQDSEIQAFRMTGGSELKVGDKIKVTGTIKNYKGTIEFDAKCTYEMVEAAAAPTDTPTPTPEPKTLTEAEILEAIKTLEKDTSIPGTQSLTGVITKIDTAYSEQYKNITVTIKVQDAEIVAFRMANGSELKVGDKIKVSGTIKNYNGTIEFDSKCTYEMVEAAPAVVPATGVTSNLPLVAMMMVLAAGAMTATLVADKRRKNNL